MLSTRNGLARKASTRSITKNFQPTVGLGEGRIESKAMKLKKLSEQTIVITGASSGIGLVTARMAAKQGARLVLAARAEDALRRLSDEINLAGGHAAYVVADIGEEQDVQRIVGTAIDRFGSFDTWVNNAGVSIYGKLLDVSIRDMRQLFETNFWGVVYGSLAAARHLREHGGAIINVGSALSDRAIPIQGIYCASKHAVKGFTDSLRMELEADNLPISVTLIKPAAVDTPYRLHARNYLGVEPKNPPPLYAPEIVAEAILHCAQHTKRDVFVGAGAKGMATLGHFMPRLTDKYMEKSMIRQQHTDNPPNQADHHGLDEASGELAERGQQHGRVAETSLYTRAALHPKVTTLTSAALAGAGLAAVIWWHRSQNGGRS